MPVIITFISPVFKAGDGISQERQMPILLQQDEIIDHPVNVELRIIPKDALISLRCIRRIRPIKEFHMILQSDKAVSESTGNRELSLTLLTQFHSLPFPIGRA